MNRRHALCWGILAAVGFALAVVIFLSGCLPRIDPVSVLAAAPPAASAAPPRGDTPEERSAWQEVLAARAERTRLARDLAASEQRLRDAESGVLQAERDAQRQRAMAQARVATWAGGILFFASLIAAAITITRPLAGYGIAIGLLLLVGARAWAWAAGHVWVLVVAAAVAGVAWLVYAWRLRRAHTAVGFAAKLVDDMEIAARGAVSSGTITAIKARAAIEQQQAGVRRLVQHIRGKAAS